MTPKDKVVALRAAWYSFGVDMKQHEVADLLDLSRSKANRLISSIRNTDAIYHSIDGNPDELLILEKGLCETFFLKTCFVCESPGREDPLHFIGGSTLVAAAAHQLQSIITGLGITSIGFGKSRTVKSVIEKLNIPYREDYSWIGLQGCFGVNLETNPFEIIEDICEKVGGEGYLLPVSAVAETPVEAKEAFKITDVSDVLLKAKNAPLYVFGIGSIQNIENMKDILGFSGGHISSLKQNAVIGDILGHFIDSQGQHITGEDIPTALSLPLSELKSSRSFAIAGGDSKAEVVRASLRGGYISDLVTDAKTAKQILDGG